MVVQTNRPLGRVVAMGVTAAMACASLVAAPIVAQAQSKTQANQQKDVQVIAFQQTWNTIAKECTNTYGPEGVAYVEVSPPQESIQGTQWWTSYQPVSYKLDSKLGTEAEFKNMVQRAAPRYTVPTGRTASPPPTSTAAPRTSPTTPIRRKFRNAA